MKKLHVVEALRGMAALSVAMFHFCNQYDSPVSAFVTGYGWLGVDVFFVISGFVISLSLSRSDYSLRDFPLFVAKRIVRLEPPYVFSIVIAIGLAYASSHAPGFAGRPPDYSPSQIAAHFLYLIPLTHFGWVNPVYWTLAYEFCFYLSAGLLFPFLIRRNVLLLFAIGGFVELASWWHAGYPDVHLWEFVVGALLMRSVAGTQRGTGLALLVVACLYTVWFGGYKMGVVVTFAVVAIYALRDAEFPRIVLLLGSLSYSLYLMHVPIGGRVVNLGKRLGSGPWLEAGTILFALLASFAVAAIVFVCIERPALAASRGLKPIWPGKK